MARVMFGGGKYSKKILYLKIWPVLGNKIYSLGVYYFGVRLFANLVPIYLVQFIAKILYGLLLFPRG